jgi:hypothetical protein
LLTLYDPTAEFEFGLDLMLDGLERFRDLRAAADRKCEEPSSVTSLQLRGSAPDPAPPPLVI